MKTYNLPARALPLDNSWDVIVVGGGPSGCTTAAAAAREGAKTLLIESTGSLGGMGTSALVPAWTPFSDREKLVYRGLAGKVFAAAKNGVGHVKPEDMDWVPIDPERLKRVYDDLVTEHGVTVLFGTMLAAVEKRSDSDTQAIIVNNKAGLRALSAKVYADCTGDADLCAWAGAEFHKGDEEGSLMPGTHCFVLTNVDEYGYLNGPNLYQGNPNSPMYAIIKSGKYPLIPDVHCCSNLIGPRTVGFNAGHLFGVDSTNPASTSKWYMQGRKIAQSFRDALAEFHPKAFGNAFLVTTGSLLGIRESRRVIGDYVLTLGDYVERRNFEDNICRNAYFIDMHVKVKEAFRDQAAMQAWEKTNLRYEKGESHGIPYRSLTPKGLRNVLVAGRSISCEQIVQGSVRVMPVCLAMGEAAGTAAAMAAKAKEPDVHRVDVPLLRWKLKEYGALLDVPEKQPA